nr:hypothetical protein [Tanacetum cinerariifolium]
MLQMDTLKFEKLQDGEQGRLSREMKSKMIFLTQTDKIAVSNGAKQSTLQAALAIDFPGDEVHDPGQTLILYAWGLLT